VKAKLKEGIYVNASRGVAEERPEDGAMRRPIEGRAAGKP